MPKRKHVDNNMSLRQYICNVVGCDKAFARMDHLERHNLIHTGEKPHSCDFTECNKSFRTTGNLARHILTHVGENAHKCDFLGCDKAFMRSDTLTTHKLTHTGEKSHKCDFLGCDKVFATSSNLATHKLTHTGEKSHECDFLGCDKAFATSSNLASHKLTHTGEKSHKCDFLGCDKVFTRADSLTTHKLIHTGEKPQICDFLGCNKAFTTSSSLATHKLTHTGEKPHKCDFLGCDKTFRTSGNLATHKLTHTGEKPHKCAFFGCDKAFAQAGGLAIHKLTHTGEKPYICIHCQHTFTQRSSLNTHLKLHERQSSFAHACEFNDFSTVKHAEDATAPQCAIRCQTLRDLDVHVQRNHTPDGIAAKFESETKLARFFEAHDIPYDRDWLNLLQFRNCSNIEGKRVSARPDFFLPTYSARLRAIVLVGNDEFGHRQYACEFQRVWNIAHALQGTHEFQDIPILYIRFNPHHFYLGERLFDTKLAQGHELILKTLETIRPEQLNPGVNLVYLQYDRDEQGNLKIFQKEEEDDADGSTHYREVFAACVLNI